MLLYHFMRRKYVMPTLETDRLKISLPTDVSDPYEMAPSMVDAWGVYAPAQLVRERMDAILRDTGMICLCANVSNPVMWAHYADCHKGVAFEFEFRGEYVRSLEEVKYSRRRVLIGPDDDLDDTETFRRIQMAMLRTKGADWSYEHEYRWVFPLNAEGVFKNKKGMYFRHLPRELRRIILGIDCELCEGELRELLDWRKCSDVAVVHARMNDSSFCIDVTDT